MSVFLAVGCSFFTSERKKPLPNEWLQSPVLICCCCCFCALSVWIECRVGHYAALQVCNEMALEWVGSESSCFFLIGANFSLSWVGWLVGWSKTVAAAAAAVVLRPSDSCSQLFVCCWAVLIEWVNKRKRKRGNAPPLQLLPLRRSIMASFSSASVLFFLCTAKFRVWVRN